jgi:hypothetical protein
MSYLSICLYLYLSLCVFYLCVFTCASVQPGGDSNPMYLETDAGAFQDIGTRPSVQSLGIEVRTSPDVVAPVLTSTNNTLNLGLGILIVRFDETIDAAIGAGGSHNMRAVDLDKLFLVNASGHVMTIGGASTVSAIEDNRGLRIILNETQRIFGIESSALVSSGGDSISITLSCQTNFVNDVSGNPNAEQTGVAVIETPDTIAPTIGTPASIDLGAGFIIFTTSETLDLSPTTDPIYVDESKYDLSKILLTDNSNLVNPNNIAWMNSRSMTLTGAKVLARENLGAPLTVTIFLTEPQRVAAIQASSKLPRLGSPLSITVSAGAFRDVALTSSSTSDGGSTPDSAILEETPDTSPPTLVSGIIDYSTGLLTIKTSETLSGASGVIGDTIAIGRHAVPSLFDADEDGDLDLFVGIERGEIVYMENMGTSSAPYFQHETAKTFTNKQVSAGFFSAGSTLQATKAASGYAAITFLNLDSGGVAPQDTDLDMVMGEADGTLHYFKNEGNGVFTEVTNNCNQAPPSPQSTCNPFTFQTKTNSEYSRVAAMTQYGVTNLVVGVASGYVNYILNGGTDYRMVLYNWAGATSSNANKFSTDNGDRASVASGNLYTLPCSSTTVCREDVLVGTAAGLIVTYRVDGSGTPHSQTGASNPARLVDVSGRGGYAAPALGDVDGDGDLDLFVGAADGTLHYYENTGTTTAPNFVPRDSIVYDQTPLSEQSPFTGLKLNLISLDQNDIPSIAGPKVDITVSSAVPVSQSYNELNITLTKTLLSHAISISGTPGGDGNAVFLRLKSLGIRDIALNYITTELSVLLTEIPDTVPPYLVSADVQYSKGILHIVLDEYIGYNVSAGNDPIWAKINLSAIFIADYTGARHVPLTGAYIQPEVNTSLYITLTEEQRVDAIEFSGTPGGDGRSVYLDILAGSLTDLAGNDILPTLNISVSESADILVPVLLSGKIDYSNGLLTITAQETIDASSVDTSKIYISDISGQKNIRLSGTSLTSVKDGTSVTIQITEAMRALAISISGVEGGNLHNDGNYHPVVLDFDANAITDIAQSGNAAQDGVFVTEIEDIVKPHVVSGSIDYNDGYLRIVCSETIDVTDSYNGTNVLDLGLIELVNAPSWDESTNKYAADSYMNLNGANIIEIDGTIITIVLTEAQRALSVFFSNTPGGGGTGISGDGESIHMTVYPGAIRDVANNTNNVTFDNETISETADTTQPQMISQSIDYGYGRIILTFTETIDLTPPVDTVDLTKVRLDNTTETNMQGAVFIQDLSPTDITLANRLQYSSVDSTVVILSLSEAERTSVIAYSGTTGGDSLKYVSKTVIDPDAAIFIDILAGAFRDLSGNLIVPILNSRMAETPDNTGPSFRQSGPQLLDFNDGTLIIYAHKTLEISPIIDTTDPIDLSKIYLSNSSTSDDVQLTGAIILSNSDSMSLTIRLNESQRIAALFWSNTPGGGGTFSLGDTHSIVLNIKYGALMDTAQNLNNESLALEVNEIADTRRPGILSVAVDFNDGRIRITANETLDVTPQLDTVIQLRKIVLSNMTRSPTYEWDMAINPQGITEAAGSIVTQASNSATGTLSYNLQNSWTFAVSGNNGITELAGATVTQGIKAGTLASHLRNIWTFVINSANIVELKGSTVSQGNSFGTLYISLTGIGTTQVVVIAPNGVGFDSASDLVFNAGTTTILASDITSATHTGKTTSVVVNVASGVVFDTFADLVIGGATILVGDLTSATNTGRVTSVKINTLTRAIFDTTANLQIGSTTILAADINGGSESLVPGSFYDNPITSDFFYKSKEFDLSGATVEQSDGLTITIILTEPQRATAIQLSSTPGGDTWNVNPTFLSIADGALKDMANNSIVEAMDVQMTETPDTTNPIFMGASIQFSTGLLRLNASETIDITPTSLVDVSKIFLVDTHLPANTFTLQLTGALVANTEDDSYINIYLTEQQRTEAIVQSGVDGGDSFPLFVQIQGQGAVDVAGNPSIQITDLPVVEVQDSIPPKFISGVLDFNTGNGILTLQASEHLDLTQGSVGSGFGWVNLSKLYLANASAGYDISLAGASVSAVNFNSRSHTLTVIMTEAQRAAAIALSGTTGGDGSPLVAHVESDMLTGFGTRGNALNQSVILEEIADTTPPSITLAAINLSTGILTVSGSETIDATPSTLVDPSLLTLVQSTGLATSAINLAGAIITPVDGVTIDVTLLESQRVLAIAISGTPGGDGVAMRIDCGAGALRDVATNPSVISNNIQVNEDPDIIIPQVTNVSFDFNNRKIVVFVSETVKISTLTDQTKFILADVSGVHNNVALHVPINGATLLNSQDDTSITFTLTESQKVTIQKFSATPGGDGTHSVLDVASNAFTDVAQNEVESTFNLRVYELDDTTSPSIQSAIIDYGLSTLTVILDEFVNSKRDDGSSLVTLSSFIFRDVHTMMDRYDFNVKTRYAAITDSGAIATFDMLDALIQYDVSHLTEKIVFSLSERTRVALVQVSGVPGGDRYPVIPAGSIASHVCSDSSITIAAINAGNARACEETETKNGAPNQDQVQNAYYDPGAVIVDILPGGLRDVANNSNAEITDCRERDTTDQTQFIGVSSCPSPTARGMVLIEIPDTVRPNITAVVIDFALGEVRLTATETMDAKPATDLILSGLFLGNLPGGEDVPMLGATVESQVSQTLTIQLTEVQRIAAMSIAGTPGGDGGKLTFTVKDSFSIRDMSSNFMYAQNLSGALITELPDTLGPLVQSCIMYLGNGTIVFQAVETVDIQPKSDVHVELMSLRGDPNHALGSGSAGWSNGANISLSGAVVLTDT